LSAAVPDIVNCFFFFLFFFRFEDVGAAVAEAGGGERGLLLEVLELRLR
jgi:hypothetical protein